MPSYDAKDSLQNRWEAGYRALGRSASAERGLFISDRKSVGKGLTLFALKHEVVKGRGGWCDPLFGEPPVRRTVGLRV